MPDEAHPVRLLGLTLDFKVNVIALIAFVLSISSLMLQGVQILRGARVTMSVGERVNLVQRVHPAKPGQPYLIVNARLDYVNAGAVGRDAIVSGERVVIDFGDDHVYEYRWLHFELFVPGKSGEATPDTTDSAHSFLVPGAGAATNQTTFVPFPGASVLDPRAKAEHIRWEWFVGRAMGKRPFVLRFYAQDRRGGAPYEAECVVDITDSVLDSLRANQWATALCEAALPNAQATAAAARSPTSTVQPATTADRR